MATLAPAEAIWKVRSGKLTQDLDLARDELCYLLDLTAQLKRIPSRYTSALSGRYISLLFEKPSLRTRLTFELAVKQLGGDAVLSEGLIGEREPLAKKATIGQVFDLTIARKLDKEGFFKTVFKR